MITLPETDNAKIGLARTYVRQNYLKTTPNCRLNWKYVAAGLCLENQYIIHGVSITNLLSRIMQGRPRRERCYKINGKLIALSKNVYQIARNMYLFLSGRFRSPLEKISYR